MFSLILAAAVAVQPAPAAKTADINIGSVKLRVPLPDGYCLPEGDQIGVAQLMAAIDTANVTLLSLNDCDPARANGNYLLVKTPIGALNADIGRSQLIAELTAPEAIQEMEKGASGDLETNERIAELSEGEASLKTDIKMRGSDDYCVYLGGLGVESIGGKIFPKAMAGCMTAVGGRLVALYSYREGSDPEGYRALMPELRRWAMQIEPAR